MVALAIAENNLNSFSLSPLQFTKVLFATCPTGSYCREDRCQSFFGFKLIPSMRAPLEDCEAAGAVKAAGAQHAIIDAPAEGLSDRNFLEKVQAYRPDLIVLAVTFGSAADDLSWAARLRAALPTCKIGIRGAPSYVWSKQILAENTSVDFCLHGDYELAFLELMHKPLEEAGGVIGRAKNGTVIENRPLIANDLDSLPSPDRSGLKHELYTVRGTSAVQATIHVQRGCPFPCTYCLVHTVSGKSVRHRSPRSIVSEIQQLTAEGINHFYLRAETFTLDKQWAIAVSELIALECPTASWVTATRVECVDEKVIAAMKRGGCYGISFGVDVTSATIGQKVKKAPALNAAKLAMRLCDKQGIVSLAYLMVGFMWDNEETLQEAAAFAQVMRPDFLTVHFAYPYPGTPYYAEVQAAGYQVDSLRAQAEPAISLPRLSTKRLQSFSNRLLLSHYLRPSVVLSITCKLISYWSRNLRSDLSVRKTYNCIRQTLRSADGQKPKMS